MKRYSCYLLIAFLLLLAGCSTTAQLHEEFGGDWQQRAQTQATNGISVTASVPSASEAEQLFGTNLYRRGVQPVWLDIENNRDQPVTFMPIGIDPAYYTPIEAANINLNLSGDNTPNPIVNKRFLESGINTIIAPGARLTGFIFTQLEEGTKAFNVDVSDSERFDTFTFFIPVPGLNVDHYTVDWANIYPEQEVYDFDTPEPLLEAIDGFACCVTDKAGKNNGDPLNLVIIGHPRDVYYSFIRAQWDETESVDRRSAWKTMKSFIGGGEYRYSPVSSLYVFGRPQDVAFQMARDNIHERNHLRLWLAPARFQGLPVWIGQISRDIGVRFTKKTITTHKIDPDVDETRESLLENLVYHQALLKFGYAKGFDAVPIEEPRGNLTGDPWFSDGYRLVLWLSSQPVALDELQMLEWHLPPGR